MNHHVPLVGKRHWLGEKYWNRCDYCGKFIGYEDFHYGLADRFLTTPDTAFSSETYKTFHVKCKNRNAPECPNEEEQR